MKKIPEKLREQLLADPFMRLCCHNRYSNDSLKCCGRIEWHHNFIYAGKQVNKKQFIVPLCEHHHQNLNKEFVDLVMLLRVYSSPSYEIVELFSDYMLYDFRFELVRLAWKFPEIVKRFGI